MKARIVLASMLLGAIGIWGLSARAQDTTRPPVDSVKAAEELLLRELKLSREYAEFEQALLKLTQRLKRGTAAEQQRAAALEKVLDFSKNTGVVLQFEQLVQSLKEAPLRKLGETEIALERTTKLAETLREILAKYREDPTAKASRDRKKDFEKLAAEIARLIREQQMVIGLTEIDKVGKEGLQKAQQDVTQATDKVIKDIQNSRDPQKPDDKNPKDDLAKIQKRIEDAKDLEKKAEKNLGDRNNGDAIGNQGGAVTELKRAKKTLDDLLRQLREEELERVLASLQGRCEKMLRMQKAVLAGTVGLFQVVEGSTDKKPNRDNQQSSLKLSDQEQDIVVEATRAIEMLESEGSAAAFPEVFQQLRDDMKHVRRRLEVTDIGVVTQAIETDIVDTLQEMVDALKKAADDLANRKNPPPPGGDPKPPTDQKLLDQIAELKMIRALQTRVNNRTQTYGKMYVPKDGEQVSDPAIRRELQNLSERQGRIVTITTNISKGDNK